MLERCSSCNARGDQVIARNRRVHTGEFAHEDSHDQLGAVEVVAQLDRQLSPGCCRDRWVCPSVQHVREREVSQQGGCSQIVATGSNPVEQRGELRNIGEAARSHVGCVHDHEPGDAGVVQFDDGCPELDRVGVPDSLQVKLDAWCGGDREVGVAANLADQPCRTEKLQRNGVVVQDVVGVTDRRRQAGMGESGRVSENRERKQFGERHARRCVAGQDRGRVDGHRAVVQCATRHSACDELARAAADARGDALFPVRIEKLDLTVEAHECPEGEPGDQQIGGEPEAEGAPDQCAKPFRGIHHDVKEVGPPGCGADQLSLVEVADRYRRVWEQSREVFRVPQVPAANRCHDPPVRQVGSNVVDDLTPEVWLAVTTRGIEGVDDERLGGSWRPLGKDVVQGCIQPEFASQLAEASGSDVADSEQSHGSLFRLDGPGEVVDRDGLPGAGFAGD